jgi:LmbE family N-acetylglucosaminyl deacetylase
VNILAIGAHPDDVELGCGATLLAHRRNGDRLAVLVMTTGERGPQDSTSRIAEQEEAARLLGADLYWGGFRDGAVPEGRDAVDAIQAVMLETGAQLLYTHAPRDSHQDHRATGMASLAASRRLSRVLLYESPTSEAFDPDVYVDVDGLVDGKVDALRAHMSQVLKNGLVDLAAVESQARYRGFQARLHWAEAFEAARFVWDLHASARSKTAVDLVLEEVG